MTAAVLALAALAAAPRPLGRAEAVALAAARAPEVLAAQAGLPVAEAQVEAAGALPNPTAGFSVGQDEPRIFGTLDQKLPFLGQRASAMDAARAEVDIARAQVEAARLAARAAASRAYAALQVAREQVGLARQQAEAAGALAGAVRQRLEAGSASELEASQAALSARRAERELADRQSAAEVARLALARAVGEEPQAPLEPSEALALPRPPPPEAELLARLERHPELLAASGERAAALRRAERERVALRPVPDVSFEVMQLPTSIGVGFRGGVAADVPLLSWHGGAIAAEVASAERAAAQQRAARHRLESALRSAWERHAAARARAAFLQGDQLPVAQHTAELARASYELGRAPLLSVLAAQTEVAQARSQAADALGEAWSTLADLQEASGDVP